MSLKISAISGTIKGSEIPCSIELKPQILKNITSKSPKLYISDWRWLKVKLISANDAFKQQISLFDDFTLDLESFRLELHLSLGLEVPEMLNRCGPWRKSDHFSITSFCTKSNCPCQTCWKINSCLLVSTFAIIIIYLFNSCFFL